MTSQAGRLQNRNTCSIFVVAIIPVEESTSRELYDLDSEETSNEVVALRWQPQAQPQRQAGASLSGKAHSAAADKIPTTHFRQKSQPAPPMKHQLGDGKDQLLLRTPRLGIQHVKNKLGC